MNLTNLVPEGPHTIEFVPGDTDRLGATAVGTLKTTIPDPPLPPDTLAGGDTPNVPDPPPPPVLSLPLPPTGVLDPAPTPPPPGPAGPPFKGVPGAG